VDFGLWILGFGFWTLDFELGNTPMGDYTNKILNFLLDLSMR
jgi:hypothetical protein